MAYYRGEDKDDGMVHRAVTMTIANESGRQGRVVAIANIPQSKRNNQDDEDEDGEGGSLSRWKSMKISYANKNGKNGNTKPHDAKKEGEILGILKHDNIIEFIDYDYLDGEHHLLTPLYAFTLRQLFSSPITLTLPNLRGHGITNTRVGDGNGDNGNNERWIRISTNISHSLLSALNYLHQHHHQHHPPIAHRDVNPSNILFDWNGILKLCDFGTAYVLPELVGNDKETQIPLPLLENNSNSNVDVDECEWNESPEEMCYDVGTGPYRAPELFFSPGTYDPIAVDLWASGCIISQLFTCNYHDDHSSSSSTPSSSSSSSSTSSSHMQVVGRSGAVNKDFDFDSLEGEDEDFEQEQEYEHEYGGRQGRKPLFDDTFGSLGLAASIFKIRGTPNYDDHDQWPSFSSLPDAGKIDFPPSNPRPLVDLLPFLKIRISTISSTSEEDKVRPHILSMIENLLALDPSRRISAKDALGSNWFKDIIPIINNKERIELMRPWLEDARNRYAYMLDHL